MKISLQIFLEMSDLAPEPLNPYAPPQAQVAETKQNRGGIGRVGFVLSCAAIMVVVKWFHTINQGAVGPMSMVALILLLLLVALRLMNIGCRIIACMLLIVPVINFVLLAQCLTLPPGYGDHRTLDTAGRIIRGLLLGFLVLALAMIASKWL